MSDPFAPPGLPQPELSTEVDSHRGPWRVEDGVVGFESGTVGPALCAWCGSEQVLPEVVRVNLGFMPWYGYLTALIGGIPLLIAHFSLFRRGEVGVYLCGEHHKRRALVRAAKPAGMLAGFFVVLIAAGLSQSGWVLAVGVGVLILAAYRVPRDVVRARRIEGMFVEVAGFPSAYQQRLPQMSATFAATMRSDIPDLD